MRRQQTITIQFSPLVVLICIAILLAAVLLGPLGHAVLAQDDPRQSDDAGTLSPGTTLTTGTLHETKVRRETADWSTKSTSFVDVPGASLTFKVPSGHAKPDGLIALFTAESWCFEGGGPCILQIVVADGRGGEAPMDPNDEDMYFDYDPFGEDQDHGESHAHLRSVCVGPGTYTVKVQAKAASPSTIFFLDDWSLRVDKQHGCTTTTS